MKQYLLAIIISAIVIYLPAAAQEKENDTIASRGSPVKFSAFVDMQVEKQLYDEFSTDSKNRISTTVVHDYRKVFDDFWMRVGVNGACNLKYFESVFNLRFYPYWTMRRNFIGDNNISGAGTYDLTSYIDAFEIARAYLKFFKKYSPQSNLTFQPHFKIGRDGMLNNSSQLFGNYLDQPAGGYGDSRYVNITGPFKNRIVFANQIGVGFECNIFDIVGSKTEFMIGGNLNSRNFYDAMATEFYQLEDSKLSAGFYRFYEDLYFLHNRFHVGGGFRKYVSVQDSAAYEGHFMKAYYLTGQWVFDVTIIKDLKFYTEMAIQKMSSESSTGIVRPINAGITIPTFGVLDMLTLEFENVANTFFSDESMRDAVSGRTPTKALGWGITLQKKYLDRVVIDWGVYTGNPTGDMKTTLRLTSKF
ncbi:MAG: hypothetical protein JW913_10230 [Chitinispirillaceae bacterium]|nr:hypothetical protein [Chitinispirillaceae bacterium]